MNPNRIGYSLLPFTHASASHTRWGVDSWNQFEASNALIPFSPPSWNSGEFAPVSLTLGWGIPQHHIAGLWLSPDMVPETGEVEVMVYVDNELLSIHRAEWTNGRIFSIYFPRAVHTASVKLTFTQSPSWIALYWVQAWQFKGRPTVVKSPIALTTGTAQRRRPFTYDRSSSPAESPPPRFRMWCEPPPRRSSSAPVPPPWIRSARAPSSSPASPARK